MDIGIVRVMGLVRVVVVVRVRIVVSSMRDSGRRNEGHTCCAAATPLVGAHLQSEHRHEGCEEGGEHLTRTPHHHNPVGLAGGFTRRHAGSCDGGTSGVVGAERAGEEWHRHIGLHCSLQQQPAQPGQKLGQERAETVEPLSFEEQRMEVAVVLCHPGVKRAFLGGGGRVEWRR